MLTVVHPARRAEIYYSSEEDIDVKGDNFYSDTDTSTTYSRSISQRYSNGSCLNGSSYVADPTDITIVDANRLINVDPFSYRWCFDNRTSLTITVVDRNGIPVRVPPNPKRSYADNKFYIQKQIFFHHGEVANSVIEDMKVLKKAHSHEYAKAANVFSRRVAIGKWVNVIVTQYEVNQSELEARNGLLYHYNTDLLLSTIGVQSDTIHPYAPENIRAPNMPSEYDASELDLVTCFRFVTNDPDERPKYVNVGGVLMKLYPQMGHPARTVESDGKNASVDASRYIEFLFPDKATTSGNGHSNRIKIRRYALTDDSKDTKSLAIFDTLEEATQSSTESNKINAKLSKRIDDLEQEITRNKRIHEDKVAMLEKEIRDKAEENATLKKKHGVEEEKIKQAREKESHEKKIHSENTKGLMGIISGLLALVPLIFKALTAVAVI